MSDLTIENLQHFCRTCLTNRTKKNETQTKSLQPVWHHIEETPNLNKWMEALKPVNELITASELKQRYPQYVCQQCYENFKNFYAFQERVSHSYNVMDKLLESAQHEQESENQEHLLPVDEVIIKPEIVDCGAEENIYEIEEHFSQSTTPVLYDSQLQEDQQMPGMENYQHQMKRNFSNNLNFYSDSEDPQSSTMGNKRARLDIQETILERLLHLDKKVGKSLNLCATLTQDVKETKNMITKIIEHMEFENPNILPKMPFEDSEDFLKFDAEMRDPTKFRILISNLRKVPATSHRDFVFRCWRTLMCDSAAKSLCWVGTKQKHSVEKLSCTAAIQDAFLRQYPTESVDVFKTKTKKFFLYANDRITKQEKYNKHKASKSVCSFPESY